MADETNTNLTPEQMAARIAELEVCLAKGSSLSFKVSEKEGVSVYGLGNPRSSLRCPELAKALLFDLAA